MDILPSKYNIIPEGEYIKIKEGILNTIMRIHDAKELSSFLRSSGRYLQERSIKRDLVVRRARGKTYTIRSQRFARNHKQAWTPEEEKTLILLHPKYKMPEIARMMGRTYNSITIRVRKLGLSRSSSVKAIIYGHEKNN